MSFPHSLNFCSDHRFRLASVCSYRVYIISATKRRIDGPDRGERGRSRREGAGWKMQGILEDWPALAGEIVEGLHERPVENPTCWPDLILAAGFAEMAARGRCRDGYEALRPPRYVCTYVGCLHRHPFVLVRTYMRSNMPPLCPCMWMDVRARAGRACRCRPGLPRWYCPTKASKAAGWGASLIIATYL